MPIATTALQTGSSRHLSGDRRQEQFSALLATSGGEMVFDAVE